jgi:serine/threonine kinase 38
LGANGIEEIKGHPFFKGIDWETLKDSTAEYIPNITTEEECSRFDNFDEEEPFYPVDDNNSKRHRKQRKDINFVGYTYKKDVEE